MIFLKSRNTLIIGLWLALPGLLPLFGHSQATEKFGQNRVQYKDFTFSYYESDNFITYYYLGGQDIAKYVIKAAEDNSDEISKFLDYHHKRKIDIVVYNNINELNQTNIGIYDPGQNPGGTTHIPDNKLFVYFNGSHSNLDQQIREGIAKTYLDRIVKGTTFGEVIQNAVLLNLPDWYKIGLEKYIAAAWSADDEDRLRDGVLSGYFEKLNKLPAEDAVFVGKSIWHYIEEVHGKSTVSNILYLTRINRSVDNGFNFVLGTNLSETLKDWYAYYLNRFSNQTKISALPAENTIVKAKIKAGVDYYQTKLSADGKYVAYASNDMGRYKVHLLNTETGKSKVLFRGGWRTNTIFTDQSIPLLAFDPSGKQLAFITDKRSDIFIRFYDIEKRKMEKNPIRKFQKVVSFSFMDKKQLVMSAIQNGQTDVYLYNIASTTTRKITNDFYDDLYPAYISTGGLHGIMFASNRTKDTLQPQRYESQVFDKQLDLFFYDLDANRDVLYRVSDNPLSNETYPQILNDSTYCFLSEQNGIRNRYIGHFESTFSHRQKTVYYTLKETGETDSLTVGENVSAQSVLDKSTDILKDTVLQKVYKISGVTASYSNYTYNIREQSVAAQKNLSLDLFRLHNRPQFRKYEIAANAYSGRLPVMENMLKLENENEEAKAEEEKKNSHTNEKTLLEVYDSIRLSLGKRPFDFQSEFDYGTKLFDWDSAASTQLAQEQNGYVFRFSKVRPYFVRFSVDKVIAQVDNNVIMTRYQPFDPASAQYMNQPMSFMIKFGITDLLENHKLYGGIRLPFVGISSNSEYFITYENLKKRLDKKFTYYRRSLSSTAANTLPFLGTSLPFGYTVPYSIKTNYYEIQLSYALDVLSSLRFGIALRNDKIVYKAQDKFSLNLPSISDNWLIFRTEYVFDNCIEIATNIRYGTRFKVFAEVQKEFPTKNKTFNNNFDLPVPQFNNKVLSVFGFDLRHYLKVYKQIIWANRLTAGASFGTAKMIFYAGGLDNWITGPRASKFDETTPINYNNNYAFQTLATPVRGFKQNARNGDKFVLFNSELRVPIFAALIHRKIKSEFIRNFQIVAFVDAGTAWEGSVPWSGNNPLFSQTYYNPIANPSVIVKLQRYKNPFLLGFGPGLRTSFLGYFIRFDTAWGYDGELSKLPSYYLSFSLDF